MKDMIKQPAGGLDAHSDQLPEGNHAILNSLLAALRTWDADTYEHSARTVNLCLILGRECGLGPDQLRLLEVGALLHDIGKIGVPDAILRKPGKLNNQEWLLMRRHPHYGQGILRGIRFLDDAARVVVQHHERWDGCGYPQRLRGEEIDLHARILAVADAFDAMINERVYRPARSYEAALGELDRCAGTQFDPRVVAAFRRVPRAQWTATPAGEWSLSLIVRATADASFAAPRNG